ncbi:hypothetical protein M441DRAFT_64317 [Trichoderma asperellum CBS 433.97]|uniref:Uncharacterized protein n=1 Tax=Trichoderma asperellum (strain ATCC 204424 / CBS 433.97 / NBRC 101777) TaxID=1042311 RepID=A0A2T3ZQI6_TRIA4|nr:hypothetical protein M441DRAFT_64317 [Trichoderma asperellum CBS 433.97]PTB47072.1 hypothetical protein M441DRAFT_64317 [Trichoderma asperellum CBS 433.97]
MYMTAPAPRTIVYCLAKVTKQIPACWAAAQAKLAAGAEASKLLRTRLKLAVNTAVSGPAPQHGMQRPLIRRRVASASMGQSHRRSEGPSLTDDSVPKPIAASFVGDGCLDADGGAHEANSCWAGSIGRHGSIRYAVQAM